MTRETKRKTSMGKNYFMTVVILMSTAVLITFLAMLINTGNVTFIVQHYLPFIVASLFVFALLMATSNAIRVHSRFKSQIFKNIAIAISAMTFSIVISVVFDVFVDNMALMLIYPALIVSVLMNKKSANYTSVMTGLIYIILLLLESIIVKKPIEPSSVIATLLSILGGLMMVSLVGKNYSRFKMVFGTVCYALIISTSSMPLSLIYTMDGMEILFNGIWLFSGELVAIALFSLILPIYENLFRVYTDFKLAELASFSQPLLVRLREEAPGTFNHSLVVANLAESCAIAVGEDPYLARVCAYYHDVGKLKNPKMFIENQDGSYNPHDELIPEVSARMITRHARAGYEMLKANHMPEEIARIALEHHGTSSVMFFYMKAQKITEGKLSMSKYKYDGPKPTTKISAIIMICDTVEAAVRSRPLQTTEELREFVGKMIKGKMDINQFDDCDITFSDLRIIEDEIVKTIPSIFHKRIDYDKAKK